MTRMTGRFYSALPVRRTETARLIRPYGCRTAPICFFFFFIRVIRVIRGSPPIFQ